MTGGKKLIVNADGFGFGAGATQGIIDAIGEGRFISSVSVNANFPDVSRVRDLIREFPNISVGVHLNPMVGRPCLPPESVSSLVRKDGCFHESQFVRLLQDGRVVLDELQAEFEAQVERVRQYAGDRLTHIDSQENTHLHYFELFLRVARSCKLRRMRTNASLICLEAEWPRCSRLKAYARRPHVWLAHRYRRYQMWRARARGMRMADYLVTVGYSDSGNKTQLQNWLRVLRNLPSGTHEIYCHPAYPDATLRRWSTYCDERARELAILRDKQLCNMARASGVETVGFDAI